MNGTIYMATNKHNGKCYVGQTIQDPWINRMNAHIKHPVSYSMIDNAIKKYGNDLFEWTVLESNIDNQSLLNSLERLHMARYESSVEDWGYNIKDGGSNGAHKQDTIKKIKQWSIDNGFKVGNVYGQTGKYRGTTYVKKDREPWLRVWQCRYQHNGYRRQYGLYEDPFTSQLVYDLIKDAIEGGI